MMLDPRRRRAHTEKQLLFTSAGGRCEKKLFFREII